MAWPSSKASVAPVAASSFFTSRRASSSRCAAQIASASVRAGLSPEHLHALAGLQLITAKPVLYAANVTDAELAGDEGPYLTALRAAVAATGEHAEIVAFSAKIEAELSELPPEERSEFLASLGIETAGLDRLVRERLYETMDPFTESVGAAADAVVAAADSKVAERSGTMGETVAFLALLALLALGIALAAAWIVVGPEKLLEPVSTSVPSPSFVRLPSGLARPEPSVTVWPLVSSL
jgi:hypothetical protein